MEKHPWWCSNSSAGTHCKVSGVEHSQHSDQQQLSPQRRYADRPATGRLHFDLRSLFLMVGFLALATAALAWRDRSTPSAMFVVAVSACGIIATISRNRSFANVLIVVICLWLAVVIAALIVTSLIG